MIMSMPSAEIAAGMLSMTPPSTHSLPSTLPGGKKSAGESRGAEATLLECLEHTDVRKSLDATAAQNERDLASRDALARLGWCHGDCPVPRTSCIRTTRLGSAAAGDKSNAVPPSYFYA